MERPRRVLVVEDEPVPARRFGRALRRAGFDVALAGSAAQALCALRNGARPDVVLLDLELGDGTAEQVLDALAAEQDLTAPRIGVMTSVHNAEHCLAFMLRGCRVLPKPVSSTVLCRYTSLLLAGVGDLVAAFAARHDLSPRETELPQLIAHAVPTKQIPDAMGCSLPTVQTYLRRILRKTRCGSREELLAALLMAADAL